MTYLVPELLRFISTMGEEIPAHTKALMFVSDFFVNYWYLILLTPVLIVVGVVIGVRSSPAFAMKFDASSYVYQLSGLSIKKLF